ncbi:MAG TPA: hypothetical protein VF008_02925 [Niastella sp.]
MYRIIYFLICSVTILSSCSRDKDATDNTKQVYERLHGKYKAVSSISSEAVDVNLDGTVSTDVLSEIPDLAECNLEILIVSKDKFLLIQSWPEQYVGYPEPAGYDPSLGVNYARQGVLRTFSLDETNNMLEVHADTYQVAERFVFPSAVTIEGAETIKIVFSKKLYTSAGWKIATITTTYKRYTMAT